jgi:hypothetical protein
MSKRPSDVHVVIDPHTRGSSFGMWCQHCGARKQIALPIGITDFARITKRFVRDHRPCPQSVGEAVGAPIAREVEP